MTTKGVQRCIERLNQTKATGPDKIPIVVLKECKHELTEILTSIFQRSLDTAEIPNDLQNANVVPIIRRVTDPNLPTTDPCR